MVLSVKCAICLEMGESNLAALTPCGHIFHCQCLHEWLIESKTCPTCRSVSSHRQTVRLFFEQYPELTEIDDLANFKKSTEALIKKAETVIEAARTTQQALRKKESENEALKTAQEAMKSENGTLKAKLDEALAGREKLIAKRSVKKAPSTSDQNGATDSTPSGFCTCDLTLQSTVGKRRRKRRGRNHTADFSASSSISQPSRKKAKRESNGNC